VFLPLEVQIQNRKGWSKYQGFDVHAINPLPTLNYIGLASYSVEVTNLSAGTAVRFKISAQKTLTGLNGLMRRIKLDLEGGHYPLNPFDKTSKVFGPPVEIISDEFVEPEPEPRVQKESGK
jgi:hypothetical protein